MFSFHAEIHKLFIWNPEAPNLPPPYPFTPATSALPCQVPGESTEHWGPARQAFLLIVGSSADQRSLPQDTRLDSGRLKRLAPWPLPLGCIPVPTGASMSRGAVEDGTRPMNTDCIPSIDRELGILDHTPLHLWSPPEGVLLLTALWPRVQLLCHFYSHSKNEVSSQGHCDLSGKNTAEIKHFSRKN